MASASAVLEEIGKDFLECGICMERYTNPKVLDCVHSFCEKCLVKYFGNDKVKPCPVCRQETNLPVPGGIGALKTNGFLITLRDKIELQEKVAKTSDKAQSTCELCTENEVTHHCLNCSQNICKSCMNIHQRIKVSADHTVGTLEDIRTGKVTLPEVQKEFTCNKHKGEINRFYCETCDVLICHVCTAVDHCKPEHQYIDRAAASSKYKKALEEIFPTFTNEIEHFEGCLKEAHTAKQKMEKSISHTEQEVKKEADLIRAKVKSEEDRILQEIRVLKEKRNTTFAGQMKSMELLLQRKKNTLSFAKYVTNRGSVSDFLSLFPIINQDLTLLRKSVSPQIDAKFHYLRVRFYQKLTHGSFTLGKLDLGDTKWELFRKIGKDGTESISDIEALQGDKIAITSRGQLIIFNTACELVKDISSKRKYYGIASFNNRLVVVGDNENVQIYNEDFTKVSQLYEGRERTGIQKKKRVKGKGISQRVFDCACICVRKDGTILVGRPSESMITLIQPADDQPMSTTVIACIELNKSPRFLASDSNDRMVFSGYRDNQVTVIDDQGVTLVTIIPTIDGERVKYCRGVCCDGSDIYVAVDNSDEWYSGEMNRGPGSGHIHRYDGDGKFLSCIVQGLNQPAGITLTEDGQHLAVVDDAKVKIYHRV